LVIQPIFASVFCAEKKIYAAPGGPKRTYADRSGPPTFGVQASACPRLTPTPFCEAAQSGTKRPRLRVKFPGIPPFSVRNKREINHLRRTCAAPCPIRKPGSPTVPLGFVSFVFFCGNSLPSIRVDFRNPRSARPPPPAGGPVTTRYQALLGVTPHFLPDSPCAPRSIPIQMSKNTCPRPWTLDVRLRALDFSLSCHQRQKPYTTPFLCQSLQTKLT
jgi:hypothetical protein